tara:strand:+ start:1202 stop:1522 length:321 start_codon:yes stop_codon:yes gene_type:complete
MRAERIKKFREKVIFQYQRNLRNLRNQLINASYRPYMCHNYYFILSQIIDYEKNPDRYQIEEYRRYLAAYKIQLFWKSIIYNPHHHIGKKFINKMYDNTCLVQENI